MATHNRKKHSRQSLRDSPELQELAELMASIAPERRGDAFEAANQQGDVIDGEEENTANNTPGRTQAGDMEFRENVIPTE